MERVPFDEASDRVTTLLAAHGLAAEDAAELAHILTTHSLAGVVSHGLHFVRLILAGLRDGRIDPGARARCAARFGAWEQWDGQQAPGPLSAVRATDRALELRTRDRQRKLISKIDSALRRIDEGDYGYCEKTGDPISLKRLDARPIATMSLEAQERHERREKVHRDD